VAKSAPDGYTLLFTHTSLAFNATYYTKLPYDTVKDLVAVSPVAEQPFVFVVHPSLPVKTIRELVALARKHPGEISYGSGGAGSGPFMGAELFKLNAGINVLHVPYKGAGPAFTDLMGGQVQMMIATTSLGLPHVKSGRVRALGVTSAKRLSAAPDLPTVAESGLPGYTYAAWYGVFAPRGTPDVITERLNQEIARITADPGTRKKLGSEIQVLRSSRQAFSDFLQAEIAKWAKVVNSAGVRAR
jgi:tripartite-type tricarboxylate transporter receptor subunit TctC